MIKIISKKRYNELLRIADMIIVPSKFKLYDSKIEKIKSVKYLRKEHINIPNSSEIIKRDVVNSIVDYLYENNLISFSIEDEDPLSIKCTGELEEVTGNDQR